MFQDMDNMVASCVFHVKVSMFTHLEQSKISLVSVKKMGIVKLTIQYEVIVRARLFNYFEEQLRQTSADILSLEQGPIFIW